MSVDIKLPEGQKENFVNGIYRCADDANYSESFGFQWNKFQRTQIDQFEKGLVQSRLRLFAETAWKPSELANLNILEVGSGAGRFTRALLESTESNVYSVDSSTAVNANLANNSRFGSRLKIFQASIYDLPFAPEQFDKVICIGVLQHTPDFKKSVACLAAMLKKNGELVIDFYPVTGWWTKIHAKYILRPITRRMSHARLLAIIEANAGWLIKTYFFFERIGLGRILNRFLPICDIKNTLPEGLSYEELKEWVVLDTFDMFSPRYDQPQKPEVVRKWAEESGLEASFCGYVPLEKGSAAVVRAIKK
ncbi:methyltransferase domain-containing protein [uncultured Imperialibacter sp.]|uniref:class I SAM-dependent methyltransferase n=1 Tax=uncultured Imperialibacter sp. TaxID=1672639 RepID=UPI0030D83339|tara:strand:- start:7928 stop:8848 length:921 start_codon:yes stop_codon:yes gene_type:complete